MLRSGSRSDGRADFVSLSRETALSVPWARGLYARQFRALLEPLSKED